MVKLVNATAEFETTISSGITVVDYYADWCGPCKGIAPKVAQFETVYTGAKFIKVDVDAAQEIATKYKIEAMPTFHIFKDGQKIDELVGANPVSLETKIKKAVGA